MFARWWPAFFVMLSQGALLGFGVELGIVAIYSVVLGLVALIMLLMFWGDRLGQILFVGLSLSVFVGLWLGFFLHWCTS
jgi:hypothetical protein